MRRFLRLLFAILTLGMIPLGCGGDRPNKSETPATPMDVTLSVPAMN